jgi:hypothetical protein
MKHVLYGLGTILSIISVIIFVSHPRDHRLDLSFSLYKVSESAWGSTSTILKALPMSY